jgi:hypothetical protein
LIPTHGQVAAGFSGRGAYRHLHWDLALAGDTTSVNWQMVSLHEMYHADLDSTTDYGSLLCVYAQLRQTCGESSEAAAVHRGLLFNCRQTHETYATYASMLTIADSGFDDWKSYPIRDYAAYAQIGLGLCRGLKGRFFRFHAALTALRLCMQAPVTDMALDVGLNTFRLRHLPPAQLPDPRLWALQRITSEPGFWQSAIAEIQSAHPEHPAWPELWETEITDIKFTALFGSGAGELGEILLRGFHSILASRLRALGIPSLEYDGHVANVSALLAACRASTGHVAGAYGLRLAAEINPLVGAAANFERERVVLRAIGRRARVMPGGVEHYLAATGEGAGRTCVVIVRWPRRLIDQFQMSPEDLNHLPSDGTRPICLVELMTRDSEGEVVLLFPVHDPGDIVELASRDRCHSSISGAALRSEWASVWLPILLEHTAATVLWDTSPFQSVGYWLKTGISRIRFGRVDLTSEDSRYTLCWAWPGSDEEGVRFLTPCSFVFAVALEVYLERLAADGVIAFEKVALAGEELEEIEPVLQYLFQTETWFDFGAGQEELHGDRSGNER